MRSQSMRFAGGKALLAALVAALLVLSTAGFAFAYYTDTSKANGMIAFSYTPETPPPGGDTPPDDPEDPEDPEDPDKPKTEIEETIDGSAKAVTVRNVGDVDAVVRVKIYAAPIDGKDVVSVFPAMEDDWFYRDSDEGEGAGFYYYAKVLKPGESTSTLSVVMSLKDVDAEKVPHNYQITIVQQSGVPTTLRARDVVEGDEENQDAAGYWTEARFDTVVSLEKTVTETEPETETE